MEKHYDTCIRIMLSLFHMLLKDDGSNGDASEDAEGEYSALGPQTGSSGRQVQGSEDGKTPIAGGEWSGGAKSRSRALGHFTRC